MGLKPLGMVKNIVEEAGMGISYAYEDLVFLDHSSFLLQFVDDDREVKVHVNSEADEITVRGDIARLQDIALRHGMEFVCEVLYTLTMEGEDSIRIEFNS